MRTLWMDSDGAGAVLYPAQAFRDLLAATHDPGVLDLTALVVTERDGGANMTVTMGPGRAVVASTYAADMGNYLVTNPDPIEDIGIGSAPLSGTRRDIVGIQVQDDGAGGPTGVREAVPFVVEGDTSGEDPALPPSFEPLYRVRVPSGTVAITNSLIDDIRVLAGRRDRPGALMDTAGSRPMSGWLPRDGAEVSRSTFAALFAEIGTTYGAGDGSTTFNVPDSRGRKLVTVNDLGSGAAGGNGRIVAVLGAAGGTATHTLTSAQMPTHVHSGPFHGHGTGTLTVTAVGNHQHGSGTLATSNAGSHAHDIVAYRVGNQSHGHLGSGVASRPFPEGNPTADQPTKNAGSHGHNITGSTANAGGHAHGLTGATGLGGTGDTGETGGGNSHPNTDPYLAVYGWIRT